MRGAPDGMMAFVPLLRALSAAPRRIAMHAGDVCVRSAFPKKPKSGAAQKVTPYQRCKTAA